MRSLNHLQRALSVLTATGLLLASSAGAVLGSVGPAVLVAPNGIVIGEGGTTVEVRLQGFEGLLAAVFWLEFDASKVTAVSASNGAMGAGSFGAAAPFIDNANGTVSLYWEHSTPLDVGDAVFFSVQFKPVTAGAFEGTSQFPFTTGAGTLFEDASHPPHYIPFLEQLGAATVIIGAPQSTSHDREDSDAPATGNAPPANDYSTTAAANPDGVSSSSQASDSDNHDSGNTTDSGLTISPARVGPNQEVTVSANICNNGEERGTKTVSLMVNGVAEQSQSVTVSGGSCRQVSFNVSRTTPGVYEVAVGDMMGQFAVLSPGTITSTPPPQQPTTLVTAGIIAIIAVMVALIAALIIAFRKT